MYNLWRDLLLFVIHLLRKLKFRYKFDDERVTKEDMNRALEEQYGGEEEVTLSKTKTASVGLKYMFFWESFVAAPPYQPWTEYYTTAIY